MKNELLHAFYDLIPEVKGRLFDDVASNRTRYLTVLLEEIYQEHNASAVLRSCDCFGIQELHVVESKNQYKVQRDIARGAGRWVDLFNYNEGATPLMDAITGLKSKGYKIAALTPDANLSVFDIPLDQPLVLSFGTEWEGISDNIREIADYKVAIPMVGFTESFNVSVSVALTLQALRQRLVESELNWKLSEEEQTDVKLKWCQRYMRNGEVVRKELEKRLKDSK
ncbi:RNA methyltransferase [Fluviicola sp.]|jgi:tRNA (guanosine-2'-O-)-methyltransferase|uniref:TrmH family RNA methyltransferase n=1 Tax=Fluviicola sp. TaxID=1917219 RepID=UPI0028238CDF|nr:RNA methyltransferase [Fluviicola sp.]MDR0801965.1 RNA methyltransferase [Fluviicola sp.]